MAKTTQITLLSITFFLFLSVFAFAGPVPDTGQTKCYDNSREVPCPQPGEAFYGQDAQYAGLTRSYTKLGQNGVALPDTATEADGWLMTRDNVTGLIWEVKTDDGGIHDKDNRYSWAEAQSVFIVQVNQQNFGGFSDWRLPTVKELTLLVNSGIPYPGPTIDTAWFPLTASGYWSSTTGAYNTYGAWLVGFYVGPASYYNKWYSHYVRAVRAGQ